MANEYYVSASIRKKLVAELLESVSNCHFCGFSVTRSAEQNVDFIEYNAQNTDCSLNNALLVCKECLTRRRKRPYAQFVAARFVELAAESAVIGALHAALLATRFGAERNAAGELASTGTTSKPAAPKLVVVPEQVSAPLTKPEVITDFDHPDFNEAIYNAWLADDED